MRARLILTNIVLVVCAALAFVLCGIDIAHAQNGFVPLAPAPAGSRIANLYNSRTLTDFMNNAFTVAIAIGAILAVLRLAFAGYLYMTTDAWGQKGKAKEVIGDVILGLLLLLSIWLILRQINPQLLNLDVLRHLPKLQQTTQQTPQQNQQLGTDPTPGFSPTGIQSNPLDSLANPTP